MKQNIFIFCFVFLLSCSVSDNPLNETSMVYKINLENTEENQNEFLNNVEIRILPLETNAMNIFKGESSYVYFNDNNIFVFDVSQGSIFRFDKNGNFLNVVNRKGQGPEEYNVIFNINVDNNYIYALDRKKILVYDFDGKYNKTIPLKYEARQFLVRKDGSIITITNYRQPYQLTVYKRNGEISEFLPTDSSLQKIQVSQSTYHSLKELGNNVYATCYFDSNIYQWKNDSIFVFAKLDFGNMNIPENFFQCSVEEYNAKFREYRSNDKSVFCIDGLVLTDDWLIFTPCLIEPFSVYYNRKTGSYMLSKKMEKPYDLFFGGYNTPDGYNASTGEFYDLVNSMDLKGVIQDLKEEPDYLNKYPFFRNVDLLKIDENSNDCIVFYKLN